MNVIEITESNYQDFTTLDIVAFSFAYEGAMGEMGGIYIIDREGQIYHANYFMGDKCLDRDHIKDVIPVFVDLEHGLLGSESKNPNWSSEYLGFGNTLLISNEIRDWDLVILCSFQMRFVMASKRKLKKQIFKEQANSSSSGQALFWT